jgi:hypothetical protein
MKKIIPIITACMTAALLHQCANTDNGPTSSNTSKSVTIAFAIPTSAAFNAVARTAEVVVSAADIDTMRQSMEITDRQLRGVVSNIPFGKNRKFEIMVYDSSYKLCYYGNVKVDLNSTEETYVTIAIRKVAGTVIITGIIQEDTIINWPPVDTFPWNDTTWYPPDTTWNDTVLCDTTPWFKDTVYFARNLSVSDLRFRPMDGWTEEAGYNTFDIAGLYSLVNGGAVPFEKGGLIEGTEQTLAKDNAASARLCVFDFGTTPKATAMYNTLFSNTYSHTRFIPFKEHIASWSPTLDGITAYAHFECFVFEMNLHGYNDVNAAVHDAERLLILYLVMLRGSTY